MKSFVGFVVLLFCLLASLSLFVPDPTSRVRAEKYFTADVIDRGLEYSTQRRFLFWGSVTCELAVFIFLTMSKSGRRLVSWTLTWARGSWLGEILAAGIIFFVLNLLVQFPIDVARLELARSWNMTERPFLPWLIEYGMKQGIEAVLGAVLLVGWYGLMRFFPRIWWLLAGLAGGLVGITFAFLMPIIFAPLFNTFTPLSQTEWSGLEPMVRELTTSAGVPVQDILVMDASRQGNHTNAYFTGFGSTRRIVLYDTLLRKNTAAEVKSVLGHELGHWIHQHIALGLLIATPALIAGFFLLDRVGRRLLTREPWKLRSLAEPAGLPMLLFLCYLGSWLGTPIQNAISRGFERQADTMALKIGGPVEVFIKAEEKLATDNLGNVAPTSWNVWLFSTHPPAVERIEMGEKWKHSQADGNK